MTYGNKYKIGDIVQMREIIHKPRLSKKIAIIVEYAVLNHDYDYNVVVCGEPNIKYKLHERHIFKKL